MFGLIEGGIGLAEMANEAGMRADEAIFSKSARGGAVDNFIGKLAVALGLLEIYSTERISLNSNQEVCLKRILTAESQSLLKPSSGGDMDFDTWLFKTSQFTGQTIGQAAGYMRMVGATKGNLIKAKDAVKAFPKRAWLATAAQGASMRTADLALKISSCKARAKHGCTWRYVWR